MKNCRNPKVGGFTLIELLVVVSIIAILASIAIPKFADLIYKAQEGATKGNLGSVRSALSIYYADNQGYFPSCAVAANSPVFTSVMVPKYIDSVPLVKNGLHNPTSNVYCDYAMVGGAVHDGQGWYYDGAGPADSLNGTLWVACDHNSSSGQSWTTY